MTKLFLYTSFHANLKFSSIPEDQYSSVLDRCYWPMLETLKDYNINLGFEFPASTLEIINSIDPGFIKSLNKYWDSGRCEVLGSGYSQTIFPLNPAKANSLNLKQGNIVYENLLGKVPKTGYVNEQTFSSGIVSLYKDEGYENLVLDWDNARKFKNFPEEYKYSPQIINNEDSSRMNVIWNSSIAFQKFQRYAQGSLSLEDYISYLNSHYSPEKNRAFLLYGYDLEIFDYRPGHGDLLPLPDSAVEFQRILSLFDYIEENENMEVVTPGEVVNIFKPNNEIDLCSSEYPIICKKQDKYNVTRWAVCGRENSRINGFCYYLFNLLENIESLDEMVSEKLEKSNIEDMWQELSNLSSSDFRTHTTDQKYVHFRNKMGYALECAENIIKHQYDDIKIKEDFVLINPHPEDWDQPFEFELQLKHGEYTNNIVVFLDGLEMVTQQEETEYYRDGSIRSVKLIIEPQINAYSIVQGRIETKNVHFDEEFDIKNGRIVTNSVDLKLSKEKGATITSLSFPKLDNEFVIGELPHGFYGDISFSPDWYSGHTVIFDRSMKKFTDLTHTSPEYPQSNKCPIRVPIKCQIEMPNGILLKTYYVYLNSPRVDLTYHFSLNNFSPLSFRLAISTFNPDYFNDQKIKYSTVNGGNSIETFYLNGKTVKQDDPVSLGVSTHHCLGATEGWVDVSDDEKGLAIISPKSQMFNVPLIHYEEVDDSYFLRVYHTISEMDDTTETFLKGHNKINFTFFGHDDDQEKVRKLSRSINQSLLIIQK